MDNFHRTLLYISIIFCFSSGCSLLSVDQPITPSIIPSTRISSINGISETPSVTQPLNYSSTPSTNPNASVCDVDVVLANLKSVVEFSYSEYEIDFNVVYGISSLAVWFVDPTIDHEATTDSVFDNFVIAGNSGMALSIQLVESDDCVSELFTHVNPIVVDQNYNGWFSGNIPISAINEYIAGNVAEGSLIDSLEEGAFFRRIPPQPSTPAPDGSCTLVEARDKILNHFDPDFYNVSLQLIVQEYGETKFYTQWEGKGNEINVAEMFNVALEIDCLYPEIDLMVITFVDDAKTIQSVWTWPYKNPLMNPDLSDLEIFYPNQ